VVGFDSAWTDNAKAPGAVCSIRCDHHGHLSCSDPQLASFDQALDFIKEEQNKCNVCVVALDQPTIVPNLGGMRPVEKVVASLISWLGGGVQPANRSKKGMFDDDAPIWRFKQRLGASDDAEAARSAEQDLFLIEVFPALAIPSLEPAYFGPLAAPRYNPGNKGRFRLSDWSGVTTTVERYATTLGLGSLATWASNASLISHPVKSDQDKLDAAICALIGMLWRTKNRPETIMVGNVEFGYMIAPASTAVRARLSTAAAVHNVPIDGVAEYQALRPNLSPPERTLAEVKGSIHGVAGSNTRPMVASALHQTASTVVPRPMLITAGSGTAKACPECGRAFRGGTWGGIDGHWKTHHGQIMPYLEAWPIIKAGRKPSAE
jgi:predicted RNase H-like nuclease